MYSFKEANGWGWVNYGDVNPIPHGGFFVRQDDDFQDCYYVVEITDMNSACGEPGFLIGECYVDLDEDWIEWDSIHGYADTHDEEDPCRLVEAAVRYYGPENFGGSSEVYPNEESAIEELALHGIVLE